MTLQKWILSLTLAASISTQVVAKPIPYTVEEFITRKTGFGLGYIQKDGANFFKTNLSSDFKVWGLSVGFDVNAYFPNQAAKQTEVNFVFNKLGYEYKDVFGAEWGRLTHVTLGQGLLVNDYDSGSGGNSTEFSPQRAGIKGYAKFNALKVEGFTTARSLYGVRASYKLDTATLPLPLTVGGTYAKDANGFYGAPAQSGYAIDVASPMGGDLFVPYVEYAKLENYGSGAGVGIRGDFLGTLSYRAEYRKLAANFVPGYFGSTYEQAPTTLSGQTAKDGFLAMLGTTWLDNYVQTEVQLESYGQDSLLTGAIGWKPILGVACVAHYTQPFKGNTAPVMVAQALLSSAAGVDTVVGIRQVYYPTTTDTAYTLGATVSLTKIFGLPF